MYWFCSLLLCVGCLLCQQAWPQLAGETTGTSDKQAILKKIQEYEKRMESYERNFQDLREEIKILKERLNEVEQDKRIEELRAEFEDAIEETESEVVQENTLGLLNRYFGRKIINISGYYNFSFTQDDKKDSPSHFSMHELTFFFQRQIYDFNLFAEVAFENAPVFEGEGDVVTGSGEIFVEQAWIEYLYHPLINLRVGLMLTPETWNLQHYPTTTYSSTRPLLLAQIFPRDFVGVVLYGDSENLIDDNFGLAYQVYISNGPGHNKGKNDDNENKVIGGKFTAHLPSSGLLDLFDLSGNLYYGKNEDKDYDFLWNVELQAEAQGFAVHVEYAQGRRDFAASGVATRRNYGGFVELAYTFWDKYSLFTRLEILDLDRRALDHTKRIVAGVRYKILPEISVKAEYFREWHRDADEENFNGFALSICALL